MKRFIIFCMVTFLGASCATKQNQSDVMSSKFTAKVKKIEKMKDPALEELRVMLFDQKTWADGVWAHFGTFFSAQSSHVLSEGNENLKTLALRAIWLDTRMEWSGFNVYFNFEQVADIDEQSEKIFSALIGGSVPSQPDSKKIAAELNSKLMKAIKGRGDELVIYMGKESILEDEIDVLVIYDKINKEFLTNRCGDVEQVQDPME